MDNSEIFISAVLIILFILIIIIAVYLIIRKIFHIRTKSYNRYLLHMISRFEENENKSRNNDNIIDSTIDLEKKLSDIMNLKNNRFWKENKHENK
jgi:predicted PurR-regulated permease PerM